MQPSSIHGSHMTHEEKMAELRRIQELMKTDPAEALRRVREGKYLPKKDSADKR